MMAAGQELKKRLFQRASTDLQCVSLWKGIWGCPRGKRRLLGGLGNREELGHRQIKGFAQGTEGAGVNSLSQSAPEGGASC